MTRRTTVAVLKTKPETVLADYEQLMKLAGFQQALDPARPTILKDNISWHFPFPAANTTPWQLEASILALRNAGYTNLSCVQNKTVVTDAFKGEDMRWVRYEPKAKMLVLDQIFPEGIMIPDYFFGKNIVHLPTVKCHIYTTTTGAMKNAFGGLLNTRRHYTHSWIHETLVDLLSIQKEIHSGIFAVMDGTTAGNGPGPRTMFPVQKDVILAGADQTAIDAVAAKLMGFDPLTIPYIRLAHENGVGVGHMDEIEVVGMDISDESWGFTVGDNGASLMGDIMWFGPLKPVQNVFMRTPLVNIFIAGSEIYHDYYRWPLKDRRTFERWLEGSPWGHLFKEYMQPAVEKTEVRAKVS